MAGATLYVCISCRAGAADDGTPLAGARLHAALAADPPPGVVVAPVMCLAICGEGCSVAVTAPGKWSYVYDRLTPEEAAEIRAGAAAYAASADGIVPWRERPPAMRKKTRARVPPPGHVMPAPAPAATEPADVEP